MLRRDNFTGQPVRDGFLVTCLLVLLWLYWSSLDSYLSSLSNPLPMKFVFATSLLVAVIYEVKGSLRREAAIAVLTTAVIFAVAPWLAAEYREWYLGIIEDLKAAEGAVDVIGAEYVRAVDNPAVGIGACFAMALATVRLPFQRVIKSILWNVFIVGKREALCPHCGQRIESKSVAT